MKKIFTFLIFAVQIFCFGFSYGQGKDSLKLDRSKIFSYVFDADLKSVLPLLSADSTKLLSEKDSKLKKGFEERFGSDKDRSGYSDIKKSEISDLLKIYSDYWRESLLNPERNYDSVLSVSLLNFFSGEFNLKDIVVADTLISDTLNYFVNKYINGFNYYTTGFGKTGRIMDLLVWKKQTDTTYKFSFLNDELNAKVIFMYDFITLGWEEYASLGIYYPGGWATDKELFCVRDSYDLNSENFKVGYLAHESRHLSDNKIYPGRLSDAEMEYRAKITEICLSKNTLYDKLKFFISGANSKSDNAHPLANYFVIKNLSEKLFGSKFESDIEKWKNAGTEKINEAGFSLLEENDNLLKRTKDTKEHFIKKEN